jgi:predicted RNase H-like nuclease (RuvC/YqgF family)
MCWGSSGPPPWVDEETKKKAKAEKDAKKIEALEKENEALKKRVKQLEDELEKSKKVNFVSGIYNKPLK